MLCSVLEKQSWTLALRLGCGIYGSVGAGDGEEALVAVAGDEQQLDQPHCIYHCLRA